jgi:hypothetical protein
MTIIQKGTIFLYGFICGVIATLAVVITLYAACC